MSVDAPERYDALERAEEKTAEGVVVDKFSGRKIETPEVDRDRDSDMHPDDVLWINIYYDLQGACGENGIPVPSEEDHVLAHRWNIRDPENQSFARSILRELFSGFNKGYSTREFKKKTPGKGKR